MKKSTIFALGIAAGVTVGRSIKFGNWVNDAYVIYQKLNEQTKASQEIAKMIWNKTEGLDVRYDEFEAIMLSDLIKRSGLEGELELIKVGRDD